MPDPERTITVTVGTQQAQLVKESPDFQPTPFGGELKVVAVNTEAKPPVVVLDVSQCPTLQGKKGLMERAVTLNVEGNGSQMFGREPDQVLSVTLGHRLKEVKPYSPSMRKKAMGLNWDIPETSRVYARPL